MELVLLNDTIVDIKDTEQYYSVFQGTFSESSDERVFDITFVMKSGKSITLASQEVSYGDPIGLKNYPEVLRYCLNVACQDTKISATEFFTGLVMESEGVVVKVAEDDRGTELLRPWFDNTKGDSLRKDSEDLFDSIFSSEDTKDEE